jgi:hypothetical protein
LAGRLFISLHYNFGNFGDTIVVSPFLSPLKEGVSWRHLMNPKVVSHYASVYLVAEIWGKERIRVADDVVKFRFKFDPEEDRKL